MSLICLEIQKAYGCFTFYCNKYNYVTFENDYVVRATSYLCQILR